MARPTHEEVEAARAALLRAIETGDPHSLRISTRLDGGGIRALRTLLAATEPTTDADLAKEALVAFPRRDDNAEREGYLAGARREGRR